MHIFLKLTGGRQLYLEVARWSDRSAGAVPPFEMRREDGERVVWLGRLMLIYTPARWTPPAVWARPARGALTLGVVGDDPQGPDPG